MTTNNESKTMTRSELSNRVAVLNQRAQEFAELMKATVALIPPDSNEKMNAHDALFAVNAAIDSWNLLINEAPRALKRAKLHLDDLVYGK